MQDLKVIGVENGALLAASEEGDRFRIPIDAVLQSRLRQTQTDASVRPKLSPREVQAHIRAGMSAEDVAAVTGASLDFVRRFEGPVVAEREYIVSSALSVPVHTAIDPEPVDEPANFGSVIRERLASLGASNERWASWKEPGAGWIVKLAFTADDIDHDARWGFEPKKNSLSPIGSEAIALSQQGELKGALIPRLRAVGAETSLADVSRFDSGAFTFKESLADDILNDTAPLHDPVPYARPAGTTEAVSKAAIKRADEPPQSLSETADLLESLRRRRGEREAAAGDTAGAHVTDARRAERTVGERTVAERTAAEPGIRLVDESAPDAEATPATPEAPRNAWATQAATGQPRTGNTGRRGRASMPSWDEIVFGARTDDDLA
ncbi:septation protein SepH [Cryobacterium sp. SO2]|uniref:septation protein SepH n=1 Tax=Cryobacterium sp. SO2 TaxID=1897060 RepID=UPI00223D38CB|nr:septation protein SepH [Cryobacterium sp. SO2]WEO75751.1 septation protein SepH [Cryobacterium sp. SO2]